MLEILLSLPVDVSSLNVKSLVCKIFFFTSFFTLKQVVAAISSRKGLIKFDSLLNQNLNNVRYVDEILRNFLYATENTCKSLLINIIIIPSD